MTALGIGHEALALRQLKISELTDGRRRRHARRSGMRHSSPRIIKLNEGSRR